jgi:hypothetical protein
VVHPQIIIDLSIDFCVCCVFLFFDDLEKHGINTFFELLSGISHKNLENLMYLFVKLFAFNFESQKYQFPDLFLID